MRQSVSSLYSFLTADLDVNVIVAMPAGRGIQSF